MKCAAEVREELKVLPWRDWGIGKEGLQRWISVEEVWNCWGTGSEGSELGTVKWGSGSVGSIVIVVILL